MKKNCKNCWIEFEITQDDLNFYDKVSPVFNWKKYQISSSTHCPKCRQQRRLAWRNEIKLYKRKCDATGKNIVSVYSEDKPYIIYSHDYWWSDNWNPIDYWFDYNFDISFFKQMKELFDKVPRLALLNEKSSINSDFCNNTWWSWWNKNCYLLFIWSSNEDSYYCYTVAYLKNCVDILWWLFSEQCYNCVKIENCFKCKDSFNIKNCSDSNNLMDCIWVKNSSYCIWLRQKEYYFLNKKYDKTEYQEILNKIQNDNNYKVAIKSKFEILKSKFPRRNLNIESCEDSYWDYLTSCSNCINCFDVNIWKDSKYCYDWFNFIDCYDIYISWSWVWKSSELLYEWENLVNCYKCLFSTTMNHSSNLLYCDICLSCKDCFWCFWLRNKQYFILNKQYTKEEYNELVPKIIEHMKQTWEWWEFFPASLSSFAYNETVAQEYFPLTKEECLNKGYKWKDEDDKIPNVTKIIPAERIPDDIKNIPDDILNWAIKCEISWRPYKIIPQELAFYREHNIPVPHLHPDERHKARMKLRNPRKLYDRKCMKCQKQIQTTYAPDRPETVYCEECYLKEVY